SGLIANSVNWLEAPRAEIHAEVQIRYRARAIECVIRPDAEAGCEVHFTESYPAVTPGQAAVFYQGDKLLGGGWIQSSIR
ncbi:MAG TPA: aminomethyltransferase beta-barrel domain-containing protein, partial [Candidatus Binatus sp.]|nr:aminomethyltransferase beta-barrel domain-containing protein [Candidatus Binatus sp.]